MKSVFTLKLREHYKPIIESNDAAHRMDHMDNVYNDGVAINAKLELNIPEHHTAIMAYCHDLFTLHSDNHHILGQQHILTTNEWFMTNIDFNDRERIANAILQHRASWRGEYSSVYSELLASADRAKPNDLIHILVRSFNYAANRLNKGKVDSIIHAVKHAKEKFGSSGYTRYPDLYLRMYGELLDKQFESINRLSVPGMKCCHDLLNSHTAIDDLFRQIIKNGID